MYAACIMILFATVVVVAVVTVVVAVRSNFSLIRDCFNIQHHSPVRYCGEPNFERNPVVFIPPANQFDWNPAISCKVVSDQNYSNILSDCYLKLSTNLTVSKEAFYQPLLNFLQGMGYRPDINLFVPFFDFRLIGETRVLDAYFQKLKTLIEQAYSMNSNKSIVLISHSFGCLVTHEFLLRQTQEWKGRYIKRFVSVAGPYGGVPMVLPVMFSEMPLQADLRTWSGIAWILANENWYSDLQIVTYKGKTYTTLQYADLMRLMKSEAALHNIQQTKQYRDRVAERNHVKCDILVPFHEPTKTEFIYDGSLDEPTDVRYEQDLYMLLDDMGRWTNDLFQSSQTYGDGFVPFYSYAIPIMTWGSDVQQRYYIPATHCGIIQHPGLFSFLTTIL